MGRPKTVGQPLVGVFERESLPKCGHTNDHARSCARAIGKADLEHHRALIACSSRAVVTARGPTRADSSQESKSGIDRTRLAGMHHDRLSSLEGKEGWTRCRTHPSWPYLGLVSALLAVAVAICSRALISCRNLLPRGAVIVRVMHVRVGRIGRIVRAYLHYDSLIWQDEWPGGFRLWWPTDIFRAVNHRG